MTDRTAWLAERRKGIGGSDVAALLGMSPWMTPFQLYLDKLGELPEKPDNAAMRMGRKLEPVVREMYEEESGNRVETSDKVWMCHEHPFMRATLDGLVCAEPEEPSKTIVEVVGLFEAKTSRAGAGFGLSGSQEIPRAYLLQVMHYMIVMRQKWCDIAALIGGQDLRIYRIEYDEELANMLIEHEAEFWRRVVERDPPSPTTKDDMALAFPWGEDFEVPAPPNVQAALTKYKEIKAKISELDKQAEEQAGVVKRHMGLATRLTGSDGEKLASWSNVESSRIDTKRLRAERPEIIAQYSTTSKTRRFS